MAQLGNVHCKSRKYNIESLLKSRFTTQSNFWLLRMWPICFVAPCGQCHGVEFPEEILSLDPQSEIEPRVNT